VVTSPLEIIDSIYCTIRPGDKIYPPFTIAVADLEQDTIIDIVVADNKHGLWLFNYNPATRQLTYDKEWGEGPNDWAGAYRLDTIRAAIPDNGSSPAIGDLDNDGALDIVIGGTNGIYAFNHRGVLLPDWPAFLDKKFWYQRGSVQATPLITTAPDKTNPLVLFASPTGENATFAVAHVDSTDKKTGAVYFTRKDGVRDSIKGLTSGFIDSLTIFGDSLILPYVTPGGYIDAFSYKGKRPDTIITLTSTGKTIVSTWPLTVGGSITTSPILYDIDKNRKPDIFALADAGWMYRWEFTEQILPRTFIWPQAGNDNSRTFKYSGPVHPITSSAAPDIEYFYNYPNPVNAGRSTAVVFKYRLSRPASSVRLDIFTYTGYQIVKNMGLPSGLGWNEWAIYISKLGSAVYRCRLEADFNGIKKAKYWKMGVVRGN
jgi:hypothetical protein